MIAAGSRTAQSRSPSGSARGRSSLPIAHWSSGSGILPAPSELPLTRMPVNMLEPLSQRSASSGGAGRRLELILQRDIGSEPRPHAEPDGE